jgi:hypothetical protein
MRRRLLSTLSNFLFPVFFKSMKVGKIYSGIVVFGRIGRENVGNGRLTAWTNREVTPHSDDRE